ncbi:MAG: cytidine deaminase [Planctomycetota bacterium]|nr:MAG: cytidine deaminase [Planctomycetota bacterium]
MSLLPGAEELVAAARAAAAGAYAPYSDFPVGAAVRCEDGRIYTGANVENASYGLGICAERVAVAGAAAQGRRRVEAVAVWTGSDPPSAPCGACRQFLLEFCPRPEDVSVHLAGPATVRSFHLSDLLPHPFRFQRSKE